MINKELQKQLRKAGYKGKFDLAKLVEACKDKKNKRLHDFFLIRESNQWADGRLHSGIRNVGKGKSPEEAVARLWLKLST